MLVPTLVWAEPYLRPGDPLAVQVGWDVALNGVLYVSYDNNHNGRVDFHTLRIVEKSFYSR